MMMTAVLSIVTLSAIAADDAKKENAESKLAAWQTDYKAYRDKIKKLKDQPVELKKFVESTVGKTVIWKLPASGVKGGEVKKNKYKQLEKRRLKKYARKLRKIREKIKALKEKIKTLSDKTELAAAKLQLVYQQAYLHIYNVGFKTGGKWIGFYRKNNNAKGIFIMADLASNANMPNTSKNTYLIATIKTACYKHAKKDTDSQSLIMLNTPSYCSNKAPKGWKKKPTKSIFDTTVKNNSGADRTAKK